MYNAKWHKLESVGTITMLNAFRLAKPTKCPSQRVAVGQRHWRPPFWCWSSVKLSPQRHWHTTMTVSDDASIRLHGSLSVALISDVCAPVVRPFEQSFDSVRKTHWATNVTNDAVANNATRADNTCWTDSRVRPTEIISYRINHCCSGQL